ncbi:MAG: hypothetical protein ABIC91_03465 [Nanoarchaeota archaeon]|nr:hypothetical protein [Nanoarchaeota archaeon]MBU1030944.1 hypothetical protein [Nanoarchaeota archaeon]MBU1850012.1 hypothetical protein [Nanoarchaeota archaeon]
MNQTRIFTPIESVNPLYLKASDDELYEHVLREHEGATFAEIKEDGYRMQIHKQGDKIVTFTKQMNEFVLDLFPELMSSLKKLPDCILDAELIGDQKVGIKGFKNVQKRFRSKLGSEKISEYLQSGLLEEFPLSIKVFDTLYWEGKSQLNKPLVSRREITEKIYESKIKPSEKKEFGTKEELGNWFEELVQQNYEGIVCKKPTSLYVPGAKTTDWIKLKRTETADLAIIGVYLSNNQISQILCAAYNPEKKRYETLAKVNAKREGQNKELETLLEGKLTTEVPRNVFLHPKFDKNKLPDYFVEPDKSTVVEVVSMNVLRGKNKHSCDFDGEKSYSMRIAWLKRIRYDKGISQVTTTKDIIQIYKKNEAI